MPLYSWRGVDHQGNSYTGTCFSHSLGALKTRLVKEQIGLVQARQLSDKAPKASERDAFFAQLSALLSAHLPLYEALVTLQNTALKNQSLRISDIARQVSQGTALSCALEEHGMLDPVARSLVILGEKTGSLGPVLKQLVTHKKQIAMITAQIRQAMLMPGITLGFFCLALCGLILWVIPQFATYVTLHRIPVSSATKLLLWAAAITSETRLWLIAGFMLLMTLIKGARYTALGKRAYERAVDALPLIGYLKKQFALSRILKVLGMLIKQGIVLSDALEVCAALEGHRGYKKALRSMREAVNRGQGLHTAWKGTIFASNKVEALLLLGQTTGQLVDMLLHAAEDTQKKAFERLNKYIVLIQPLLLLGIAGLVAGLIISLYMPLITFAASIEIS